MSGRGISDEQLIQYWHEIVTATGRLHRLLDADLEAAGVPAPWYPALELLLRAEEHRLPMSTLARELTMTSGGFSKLADRMAADGLIDRRGTVDDRRVVHATLTANGLTLARRAHAAYVEALRRRLVDAGDDPTALAAASGTLKSLVAAPPDAATDDIEHVARERDPALPDRRGRGHGSGVRSH